MSSHQSYFLSFKLSHHDVFGCISYEILNRYKFFSLFFFRFWLACEELKTVSSKDVSEKVHEIYRYGTIFGSLALKAFSSDFRGDRVCIWWNPRVTQMSCNVMNRISYLIILFPWIIRLKYVDPLCCIAFGTTCNCI